MKCDACALYTIFFLNKTFTLPISFKASYLPVIANAMLIHLFKVYFTQIYLEGKRIFFFSVFIFSWCGDNIANQHLSPRSKVIAKTALSLIDVKYNVEVAVKL